MNPAIHAREVLKKYWSYDAFRPLQEEIISSVISGKDTFALLPTGGGKSICYQLPALYLDGTCLVISPLISLMSDQSADLKRRNIRSIVINSFMDSRSIDRSLDNAVFGDYKLIYVSPERIKSAIFLERFRQMKISFIAVDEAHCISQWGYDFRPSYMKIHELRAYHDVPVMALTATATSQVAEDIILNLKMKDPSVFRKSFARDNIFFSVEHTGNKTGRLNQIAAAEKGSGIVYIRNRRKCREVAESLKSAGISADYYHAGLSHEERQERQDAWTSGKTSVIAATNAFGMGIDKADVRFVVHCDLPDSLEAFYQEAGRAGRDGKESRSVVLMDESDRQKLLDNFEQSFPEIEEIREIYHLLCNHFQIAEGSVVQDSLPFHLPAFASKFNRNKVTVFQCLKQLEQEGHLLLSGGVYKSSRIRIIGGKYDILQFRQDNPDYSDLIMYLLRAYSGIIDQAVGIDESEIASKTGLTESALRFKLEYLAKHGLLKYEQGGSESRISFLTARMRREDVTIAEADYSRRKEAHRKRMTAILAYADSEKQCRSNIILSYFDEKPSGDCGHCDSCRRKSNFPRGIDKARLHLEILQRLKFKKNVSLDELRESMPQYSSGDIEEGCRELCLSEEISLSGRNAFSRKDGFFKS